MKKKTRNSLVGEDTPGAVREDMLALVHQVHGGLSSQLSELARQVADYGKQLERFRSGLYNMAMGLDAKQVELDRWNPKAPGAA